MVTSIQPTIAFLCNGLPQQTCALTDRGLHYGDGVFETIAVFDSQPQYWQYHLDRLNLGCERLAIPVPSSQQLLDEALSLCQTQARAILKIIITRGSGGRGYAVPNSAIPTRIVALYDWPSQPSHYYQQGIQARICSLRLGHQPFLAGIKHLNRLEQVLARNEWQDETIQEGLLLDQAGSVIAGTKSNLFMVKHGQLITPDLHLCGIAGVMRRIILEMKLATYKTCKTAVFDTTSLFSAEEIFVSNSIMGIWPVTKINEQSFLVGPLTRAIMAQLRVDRYASI